MKSILTLFLVLMGLMAYPQPFTCGTSTVTDIDGNVYHTVQIGNQCWMKENMNTTRYADGQAVGMRKTNSLSDVQEYINNPGNLRLRLFFPAFTALHVNIYDMKGVLQYHADRVCRTSRDILNCIIGPSGMYVVEVNGSAFRAIGNERNTMGISLSEDAALSQFKSDSVVITDTSRNYFDYDDDPSNGVQYGKLYTWLSALNVEYSNNPQFPSVLQGICPNGWHVPNDSDWIELEIFAGMSPGQAKDMFRFRGTIDYKLKIAGPEFWYFGQGTDDFGFAAKGSGWYNCDVKLGCSFYFIKNRCTWWTYNENYVMERQLSDWNVGVWRSYYVSDASAFSVRCVRNKDAP